MASPQRGQIRVLADAFLLRFFENEAMANTTDLRSGFFWVIAALASPGIFLPQLMYFRWSAEAQLLGVPSLQAQVLVDKSIYLGLTCVGISLLTAVIWQSLLIDRRDGLILGSLPIRTRTVVAGKFAAILMYLGLITAGMHGISTLLYGVGLSSLVGWSRLVSFTAGQLAAAAAANLFIFSLVVGAQSLAVAIWGPRRFTRISSALQIIVVGAATGLLLVMPFMAGAAPGLATWTPDQGGWLLWMPPIWFVGLNEQISGTTFVVMPMLATRALLALGAAMVVVLIAYPVAARRTLAAAVAGSGSIRAAWTRSVAGWLARRLGRDQHERGAAQFMLSALARSHQQRLILALSAGAAMTVLAPAVLMYVAGTNLDVWRSPPRYNTPIPVSLIAAPLLLNFIATLSLRMAIAIPSELDASWLFAAAPAPMFAGRNAARRLLVLVSVIVPLVLITPVWWSAWGWRHTLPLVVACLLGMLTVVEGSLWGFVGIPCAKPLATGRSNLTSQWPGLLIFLYFYASVFPSFQVSLTLRPGPQYMLLVPALIWYAVRRGSQSAAHANGVSGDPHGYLALNLSTTAASKSGVRTSHASSA